MLFYIIISIFAIQEKIDNYLLKYYLHIKLKIN